MSQAKVDRYKEEKKNRKKTMAKEPGSLIAIIVVTVAVWLAGLVCPVTASMRARSRLRPFTPMSMPSPIT